MSLDLQQLHELWGPPLTPAAPLAVEPLLVSTDSRRLSAGGVFLALVGERFDGHRFLRQALAAGSRALVAQRDRLSGADLAELRAAAAAAGAALWLVDDTLQAYQDLGRLWRERLAAPVVAVTGSAGKTSTRELIRAVLAPLGPVLASSGNENNDVGVPLTLLRAGAGHCAVVVEMGMRGLGEIERLSRCARPDVAVITNLGTAHIGRLGSREAIGTAKCEIVTGLAPGGVVVIPSGDPLLDASLTRVWSGRVLRVALCGDPGEDDAELVGVLDEAAGCLEVAGVCLPLPLEGRHQARNLMLALAVAQELGLPPARWQPLAVDLPGGRSRRLELAGVTILDETYNASPEAMLASLELLARQQGGRRYAVLGTMLELGERGVELHRQVAERAVELGLDGLVLVVGGAEGDAMAATAAALPRLARVPTPEQAAEPLRDWLESGDVVLLKASRSVALERLLPLLQAFRSQLAGP
ncbi:UDP-N-acetylmuramoyl-tripeptide--D-alanyl-D-alanine ligase [Cyanobium sp. ATX 6A2]|uniref:UDP-N-acetylmuramoyl-tripeptide--D-alanyl-D- alanine ligase n=1 Tax=Cyanobium sp. ATX 6A2 TaxID=2823700 RepID=UPI0020CE8D33|nr:UDP-N-acetylmuramoyl-tripeptide--D-alanyl-D-alanine ligase [Cyanobium sp. ATX 6A2]MCP9888787.1 UDP-N-acetylmuramoyl-tripeptide--D-alanyl-D-alanine ligase [Cyanobium sp. ATX 6A2]